MFSIWKCLKLFFGFFRTLENLSDDDLKRLGDFYKRLLPRKIHKNEDNSLVEKVRVVSKQYSATLEKESKKVKPVSETKKRRTRTSSETVI